MIKKLIIFIIGIIVFSSCNDDDAGHSVSHSVNDFVWKGMNSWYLWKNEVPNLHDNRFSTEQEYMAFISGRTPENLFYSLLYNYPETDRFSWMVEDVNELVQSFSGVEYFTGMDFTLAYLDDSQGVLVGMVNYIVAGSPADLLNIRRGDIFYAVNGQELNTSNYLQLYDSSFNLTFATDAQMTSNGLILSGARSLQLNTVQLEEDPVHYANVFNEGDYTVGYLVFNAFRANYNDELNDVMAEFQQAGIDDLILDLRYNRGGSLATALAMGQMITGQFEGSPFVSVKYNQSHQQLNNNYVFNPEMTVYDFMNGQNIATGNEQINSLGLNRLFVLTSGNTASASELVISCLSPYIDVILIGAETSGKFVGSRTLVDHPDSDFMDFQNRNHTHNYALQPIVFSYNNSQNQFYTEGISPDYQVSIAEYFGTLGEFGDLTRDAALAQALSLISGSTYSRTPVLHMVKEHISTRELKLSARELYIDPE